MCFGVAVLSRMEGTVGPRAFCWDVLPVAVGWWGSDACESNAENSPWSGRGKVVGCILAISFCAKELVGWGSHLHRRGHPALRFRRPGLEELLLVLCSPLAGALVWRRWAYWRGGKEGQGTGDGSRGKKLSAEREMFFPVTFFDPHLSQGKEVTWVLKKMRICVRLGSFNVCRDVLKCEWGTNCCVLEETVLLHF